MLGTIVLVLIGVLIGWNTTQPAVIASTLGKLKDKVKTLFNK
jgi:hypothetical protein